MNCAYCNKQIQGTDYVGEGNLVFCNSLHRHLSRQSGSSSNAPASRTALNEPAGNPKEPAGSKLIIRRIVFGFIYGLVLYFAIVIIGSGIAGGIAGANAGVSGGDASESGRLAGTEFAQRYRIPILAFSIAFAVIGTVKGKLPGTKKR
ncbi:MAG TPA: hypothetical protein VGR15_04440 [Bacteroidota bacterium]|jgi:hypothetical protein|nr:hypothetical protein [Bacteroidota bacterium]